MPGIVFFGHENRDEGTSEGTYVVPGSVRIHFFVADGQSLRMSGAKVLLAALLRDLPCMNLVRDQIVEAKEAYSTIPNYVLMGDHRAAEDRRSFQSA